MTDTERLAWFQSETANAKRLELAHERAGNAEMAQFFRELAREVHVMYDHSCRMAKVPA